MSQPRGHRWRGRPFLSAVLRLFVFAAPISAAVATSAAISDALGPAHGFGELPWHIALMLSISTGVLFGVDRLARRLLPLAVLLKLSLAFPDEAPSRLRVARNAANTRDLEARVRHAQMHGIDDEPTRAAEQILSLIAAVEAHDRATRGHSERVRVYTDMLADQMELSEHDRDRLRWAAMLHDVGKIDVPAKVLNKPSKLTPHEWELIKAHPDAGARLVGALRPWLGGWVRAIEEHHERVDGTGYPRGLTAETISLGGRIVAVTDAYETMTASRPYRRAQSAARARAELVRCSGTHFDPVIVRSFLEISIRRLTFFSGPLSWLAQTPLWYRIELVAGVASNAATSVATAGAAAALTMASGMPRAAAGAPKPVASTRTVAGGTISAGATTTSAQQELVSKDTTLVATVDTKPSDPPSPEPSQSPSVHKGRPGPSPSPTGLPPLGTGTTLSRGRHPTH